MTVRTYGLALETLHKLIPLKLPAMTLQQAQQARSHLAGLSGKTIHVINVETMREDAF